MIRGRYDQILAEVQKEVGDVHTQTLKRQGLISKIEERLGSKLLLYVAKVNYPIDYNDIPIFGSMLAATGEAQNIDLLIQSGGGIGTVSEKMVEMIRQYCKQRFRVIVPNLAKSAATMVALGADQIIMGVTSELGPIDAQVEVRQGGVPYFISAQSFVDTRDRLEKLTIDAVKKDEPHHPYVAQLSALNSAFVDHCEKSMNFAKDFATKALASFMLRGKENASALAQEIANDLSSASKYFTHGRTISAKAIKTAPPLNHLNIEELPMDREEWQLLFELYLRTEIFLDMDNQGNQRKGKLFESANFSMVTSYPM